MDIYHTLKKILKEKRLSTTRFAIEYDFSSFPSIMSKLKAGKTKQLDLETIRKIETALNIKIDDSDSENISYERIEGGIIIDSDIQLFSYPILSQIGKGLSMESLVKENTIAFVALPYTKKKNCFAFIVQDNAMANKIEQGDIVLTDIDVKISDNDIVIALLKDGKQIIRKYREVAPNIIMLFTDNSNYSPITVQRNEIEAIYKIVGTWKKF